MQIEHELHGSICLFRAHDAIGPDETFKEFVRASFVLGGTAHGWSWGQPFWYVVRQTFELGLKMLVTRESGTWPNVGHDLGKLLMLLPLTHDVHADPELVAFIRALQAHDPNADQGRYDTTRHGELSLKDICCIDPAPTLYFVDCLRQIVCADEPWPPDRTE